MRPLFKLRGSIEPKYKILLQILGFILLLFIWASITYSGLAPPGILPKPWKVITALKELHFDNALVRNILKSIYLNFSGYMVALIIALPIGFLLGLIPLFRGLFQKPFDTLRFLPLTAVIGLFVAWFGIENPMKIYFLAFGILVYLIPVIIQRIDEVDDVYLKTVFTLGATSWQTIKTVYLPSVLSRISDDVRVLVAISWTYIIIAELQNNTGGLGALIFQSARNSRIDKVFALLIIIIIIGLLQDRWFFTLDKFFFPHKHVQTSAS